MPCAGQGTYAKASNFSGFQQIAIWTVKTSLCTKSIFSINYKKNYEACNITFS